MGFPSESELKRIREKFAKVDGTFELAENPSPLQLLRWDLCQRFIIFKQKSELNQKQLAELLEIDEAKISKILRHRIDEFSTDRLISLYTKLDPNLKLKIS